MKISNIVFFINSLGDGGAERMLLKIVSTPLFRSKSITIVSLKSNGKYKDDFINNDCKVIEFRLKNLREIFQEVKSSDVALSWLYISDFFLFVIGKLTKVKRMGWNLRHGNLDVKENSKKTILFSKLNAKLSSKMDFIISCSYENIELHESIGYKKNMIEFIPNGFESEKFFKLYDTSIKKKLLLPSDKIVFLTLARWDKQKGFKYLIEGISKSDSKNSIFLLGGKNIDENNVELMEMLNHFNVKDKVMLLGQVSDVQSIYSISDCYISSSIGEGFPNVLGESMLCECMCIATNVGESPDIIGNNNIIINSKSSSQISDAIDIVSKLNREEISNIGKKNRERIISKYDIKNISEEYIRIMSGEDEV